MNHWELIKTQALKFQETNTEWTSLGGRVRYKFVYIDDDKISIDRLNGGEIASLGKRAINSAVERLKQKGRLNRVDLINSVVRQSTLIYLHPFINWDTNKKEVFWDDRGSSKSDLALIIQEASDDELNKIQVLVNKRSNQSLFKKNLMTLYSGKCAISKVDTEEVLEAAHVLSHSQKGINSTDNGILLRSDLHKLFDKNLLLIHPKTLKVYLEESIDNPEYVRFVGMKISDRIDNSNINSEFLQTKWGSVNWTTK